MSIPAANPAGKTLGALSWIGFVAVGALPLAMALAPADWAGWLLLFGSYALLLAFPEFRRSGNLAVAGFVVLTTHHLIAIVNAYVGTVIGADTDAYWFNVNAALIASGVDVGGSPFDGATFYNHFLAFFYGIFGSSQFLGEELSVLSLTLSCVVLVKICRLIHVTRFLPGVLLVFGLAPSGLIFLSVTLREAWQLLFVLLAAYWLLRIRAHASFRNIAVFLAMALILALWHQGLLVYTVFMIVGGLFWAFGGDRSPAGRRKRVLLTAFFVLLVAGSAGALRNRGGAAAAIASGNVLEYAQAYRLTSDLDARASYGIQLDASSPLKFAVTLPLIMIQYMFAPFPWQIGTLSDIEAMLEGFGRFILLYMAWRAYRTSSGEVRDQRTFLLGLYLIMEFLWGMGTVNWGTAARHHLLAYSLLALTGGPTLMLALSNNLRSLLALSRPAGRTQNV